MFFDSLFFYKNGSLLTAITYVKLKFYYGKSVSI